MAPLDSDEDVGRVLKEGYGVPAPRPEFVEDLRQRLLRELDAARVARRRLLRLWGWVAAAASVAIAAGLAVVALRDDVASRTATPPYTGPVAQSTPDDVTRMVPLGLQLPPPLSEPTPKHLKPSPYIEPYRKEARPPFLVPAGTVNLAAGRPVAGSDPSPIIGEVSMVTDGDKRGCDGTFAELGPLTQWVRIDLGRPCPLYAIVLWHYFGEGRIYHDVIVQVSDDPDFIEGVRTLYNNDYDNSSGLGIGKDLEYLEDNRGRLIDAGGVTARYVRLSSRGNTSNDQNHYVEVEVYGKPPADAPPAKP